MALVTALYCLAAENVCVCVCVCVYVCVCVCSLGWQFNLKILAPCKEIIRSLALINNLITCRRYYSMFIKKGKKCAYQYSFSCTFNSPLRVTQHPQRLRVPVESKDTGEGQGESVSE